MIILSIIIFILGYLAIAFEQPLRLNKAASALITGVLCWLCYFIYDGTAGNAPGELLHHFGEISSILFFLLGAMIIVEIIDAHHGFDLIRNKIITESKIYLLVIISVISFFLSAILDNLTTAIVMTSLSSKLLQDKEDRLWFAGMIIISVNAGGVWSPLGDVTTTMLWIGGQITAVRIATSTFFPSLAVIVVPLILMAKRFRHKTIVKETIDNRGYTGESVFILLSGILLLFFVPVFKILTGMPPFMGMLLALGIIWIITSVLHYQKQEEKKRKITTPAEALQRIDAPSILFFLGILLAVSALESFGILKGLAGYLDSSLKNDFLLGGFLGILSALVDNVPLVAATQGMYDLTRYGTDHYFWQFLALTTGTGGSIIIIGSAAGVAVMGIAKIGFKWYLQKISWLAFLGFATGAIVFVLQHQMAR